MKRIVKDQTLSIFAAFRLGLVALALVALVLVDTARVGSAQTGSRAPLPTYDWDDNVPGTQGPTSPLLAGAPQRALRMLAVQIPLLIPLTELQAVLPPGFNAVATPAGSNTGQLTLTFAFQQRVTRIADGQTVGGSALLFQVTVLNTNLMPNRQESGLLGYEFSSQELVDRFNEEFGPGTARLANVHVQIGEDAGNLTFKSNVTDDSLGLNVSAQATCPGPLVNRTKNDPVANVARFLIPQRSFFTATQHDNRPVPQAMANVQVETPDGRLMVPVEGGGSRSLTISGIGANITFLRNQEIFTKLE